MKRLYLSGQNNFGNRGCEALVRSTLELLKAEFGDVEVKGTSFNVSAFEGEKFQTTLLTGSVNVKENQTGLFGMFLADAADEKRIPT